MFTINKRDQHFVSREAGWATRATGAQCAAPVHLNQRKAIDPGRPIVHSLSTELFINSRDRRIGERDFHGSDLFAPRG